MSKERLTEKTKDCFGYRLKDGSDSEVGFFKDYDAFYSHMMTVKALGEYEDLEEQGLILRLPCKVGDTVYRVYKDFTECEEFGEKKNRCEFTGCYKVENNLCLCDSEAVYDIEEFKVNNLTWLVEQIEYGKLGQTIFLTREEAEEKLRELEGK